MRNKETLRGESLNQDHIDNGYFRGQKLEVEIEKLVKVTNAKEKSKSMFRGLLDKYPSSCSSLDGQQPFRQDPLSQNL